MKYIQLAFPFVLLLTISSCESFKKDLKVVEKQSPVLQKKTLTIDSLKSIQAIEYDTSFTQESFMVLMKNLYHINSVSLGPGDYIITEKVLLDAKQNLTIFGNGKVRILIPNDIKRLFAITNCKNIKIENIQFITESVFENDAEVLYFENCAKIRLNKLNISGAQRAIECNSCVDVVFAGNEIHHNKVCAITIDNNQLVHETDDFEHYIFINNKMYLNGEELSEYYQESNVSEINAGISFYAKGGSFIEGIPEAYEELQWFGLFYNDSISSLKEVQVTFQTDSEMGNTGYSCEGKLPDFIFSGLMEYSITPQNTLHVKNQNLIDPEYETSFELNGNEFTLQAKGFSTGDKYYPAVAYYEFGISGLKNGVNFKQALFCRENARGTLYLRWVGDIDADNLPDFIFEESPEDISTTYTLFLSSMAEDESLLVARVASFEVGSY